MMAAEGNATASDPQRVALERALGTSYEIARLLGRGGMGAVYLARERALERAVAIKVLPHDMATDSDSRERFRREARTAAKLTHPNIVPLHTFGDADGMLYFVMGYVRGESLADRMARDGRMPPGVVRRILGELASALDYAHRQGVVHRDIKPDNVLLDDESGRPMLTDFGVAKARAQGATLTEAGALVGTPHYMSPEQASGARDVDGRSDLYSLGVMGYAMLAGRLPFEGESFRDVIVQHVTKAAVPLSVLVPDAPTDIASAITRCLAKNPLERWSDGQALRNALEQGMDDDDELGRPESQFRSAVPVIGSLILADALAAAASYASPSMRVTDEPWWGPYAAIGATLVVLPLVGVIVLRAKGVSWAELRRNALLPPRWWAFWYPPKLRAESDVWFRLPPIIRRFRAEILGAYCAMAVGCGSLAVDMYRVIAHPSVGSSRWLTSISMAAAFGAVAMIVWTSRRTMRWGRDRGLTQIEAQRFAFTSTSQLEVWRKPKYAALLLSPGVTDADHTVTEPAEPAQFIASIGEAASQLRGPARELGTEALAAARQAVVALSIIDAEISVLARDASAGEIAAIEQKLAALGNAANEPASRRELRQVLGSQRDLLKRLAEQLAAAVRHRERVLDLLRTLWLQIANLRAQMARETRLDGEITGRVRSVLAELSAYSGASAVLEEYESRGA